MPPPDVAERKSDHWGCEGVQNCLRHASLYHLKQLFRSQHGVTGGGLDYICMGKIYIQDAHNHILSFDLKDVLAAIGQPALEAYWTVGSVERTGEPLEVIGKDIRLVEALAASGERVSGYRLQELAADIRRRSQDRCTTRRRTPDGKRCGARTAWHRVG